jgi:hypothetical protein
VSDESSGFKMDCRDQLDNYQLLSENVYIIRTYLDSKYVNKISPKICCYLYYAIFMIGLFCCPEDGGDTFLRDVR